MTLLYLSAKWRCQGKLTSKRRLSLDLQLHDWLVWIDVFPLGRSPCLGLVLETACLPDHRIHPTGKLLEADVSVLLKILLWYPRAFQSGRDSLTWTGSRSTRRCRPSSVQTAHRDIVVRYSRLVKDFDATFHIFYVEEGLFMWEPIILPHTY